MLKAKKGGRGREETERGGREGEKGGQSNPLQRSGYGPVIEGFC